MTDYTPQVLAACATVAPTFDARVPPDPPGAHVIAYGGSDAPYSRDLADHEARSLHAWRLVCASNNPRGCRTLTKRVKAAVDGLAFGHSIAHVVAVTDPIEDRDDPSQWRWSATVELHLIAPARDAGTTPADVALADLIP